MNRSCGHVVVIEYKDGKAKCRCNKIVKLDKTYLPVDATNEGIIYLKSQ